MQRIEEEIGGLGQNCGIFIANSLEIPHSCAKQSKYEFFPLLYAQR